jgi:hypothetical protein
MSLTVAALEFLHLEFPSDLWMYPIVAAIGGLFPRSPYSHLRSTAAGWQLRPANSPAESSISATAGSFGPLRARESPLSNGFL